MAVGPAVAGLTLAIPIAGTSIGTLVLSYEFYLTLVIFYFFGFIPASLTAIVDGLLLRWYKGRADEISFVFAILLGGISGLIVALCFNLLFRVWPPGYRIVELLLYLSIFLVPGAVCGLFNKIACRQL